MKRMILVAGLMALMMVSGMAKTQVPGQSASKADFALVIREFDAAACKRLSMKSTVFPGGEGKVTRDEVIAAMDTLMTKYQEKFRVTPRPYAVYPEVIDEFNKSSETRESLRKLSRWGMIGPVSRLVANKGTEISEEDLGDALGYFYTRVMTYTHQPDPSWTPSLQGGE